MELDNGERVESDDELRGVAPQYSKCPASIGSIPELEALQSLVRSRHETINKHFKQWSILKHIFQGDISQHGEYVSMITQLAIKHGEPLFQVDYEDPNFDDYNFNEHTTGNVEDPDEFE
jgi:hypothetical protein